MHKKKFNSLINHKLNIASSFGKSSSYYNKYASFQRICGYRLCSLIGNIKGQLLLDAGCGTGWFSQFWSNKGNLVISLDFSIDMLEYAKKNRSDGIYILGDIEKLPFINKSINIVFSNLVVQWCDNLSKTLSELYRILRPGGLLALSVLSKGSLFELEYAWKKIDNNIHVNPFFSYTTISSLFSPYRHYLLTESYLSYYKCLIDIFRDIKGVGANYLYYSRKSGLFNKNNLQNIEKYWPKRSSRGFPLSYQVIYGILYRD